MKHKAWCSIEEVPYSWRRHQMETFSALLVICAGNSPVNSLYKGQWRGALMFSLICAWINGWVNNREAGDLRRNRAHCDVTVMIFQGHPSNFKLTRDKKSLILIWIERFRTVTQVWIHRWLWNDGQSLTWYSRGAILFFKVIHQISMLHGTKQGQSEGFDSCDRPNNLTQIGFKS